MDFAKLRKQMAGRKMSEEMTLKFPVLQLGVGLRRSYEQLWMGFEARGGEYIVRNVSKGWLETSYYGVSFRGQVRHVAVILDWMEAANN